jgi:hypothetical protein
MPWRPKLGRRLSYYRNATFVSIPLLTGPMSQLDAPVWQVPSLSGLSRRRRSPPRPSPDGLLTGRVARDIIWGPRARASGLARSPNPALMLELVGEFFREGVLA